MKYLNIIALAVVSLIMFNCTKNDESTVILLGKETYVEDIINVIPDTLQTTFTQHYGTIHEGYIPPNIEGNYVVARKKRVYSNIGDSWPLQIIEPNMYIRIQDQHNRVARFTLAESTTTETDTVFVVGNDNYFTLYYIENKEISYLGYSTLIKRAMLMSGEVCAMGLKDLYVATIILDVYDDSGGAIVQYKKGDYFIYKDEDGLAVRQDW